MPTFSLPSVPVLRAQQGGTAAAPSYSRALVYLPSAIAGSPGTWQYEERTPGTSEACTVSPGAGALRFLQAQRRTAQAAAQGGAWPARFLPGKLLKYALSEAFSPAPFFPGVPQSTPPLLLRDELELDAAPWLQAPAAELAQQVRDAVQVLGASVLKGWPPYLAEITPHEPALVWLASVACSHPEGVAGLGHSLLHTSAWLWHPEGVNGWSAKFFLRLLRVLEPPLAAQGCSAAHSLTEDEREVLRLSAADFCYALAAFEAHSSGRTW